MADFRIRFLGLAVIAATCAGLSYGATTISCPSIVGPNLYAQGNPTLRAESTTELVADVESIIGGAPDCTASAATTGSVIATLSLPVTSKAVTYPATVTSGVPAAATTGNSDAVLRILVGGADAPGSPYFGSVSGTQVSFSNVSFPAGAFAFDIQNIRVNASTGGTPQVTETVLLSYATGGVPVTTNLVSATQNVGFILSTLGATSLVGAPPFTSTSYTTCAGNTLSQSSTGAVTTANLSFTVAIKELVAGAFKTQLQEGGSYTTEPAGVSTVGTASSATLVTLTLANVRSAATVYVPQSVTVGGTQLQIANSTPVTSPNAIVTAFGAGFSNNAGTPATVPIAFTPVSNVVTVTYTTLAAASVSATTFNIPVYVVFAANSAAAQGPVTILESYAPAGAASSPATSVPNFAVSTATPVSGSTIVLCQTNLLFPFVTNAQGFDTGIVLANTSTDNLGVIPGTPSSVKAQHGTCTLSFYGTGLPTPSTGVADPLGDNATAGTHAFLLSSVASGFQGYMIASCPFQYAHGFAFLAYNLTQANGVVEGYIAEVLSPTRATSTSGVTVVGGAVVNTTTSGLPEATTF